MLVGEVVWDVGVKIPARIPPVNRLRPKTFAFCLWGTFIGKLPNIQVAKPIPDHLLKIPSIPIVSGRITGYNPFPNGQAIPQTIGIDGIFNKWSGIGLATWIFGNLPMKVPHKQKAKVLGRNLLTGGILAGIFTPTSQTTSPTNMSQISISAPVSSNAIVGGTQ
jgi:hypothetical protein